MRHACVFTGIVSIGFIAVSVAAVAAQSINNPSWKQFTPDTVRMAPSPDGKTIATVGNQKGITLWDLKTGKQIRVLGKFAYDGPLAFTPDGKTILIWGSGAKKTGSAEWNTGIHAFRVADGTLRKYLLLPCPQGGSDCLALDNKTLIVADVDKVVAFYDIDTGKKVGTIAGEHRPRQMAVSPDRKWLLTADYTSKTKLAKLRLWNLKKRKLAHELYDHTDRVAGLCFSADGRFCASATWDGRLFVFDCAKGDELGRTPTLMRHPLMQMSFTPDGKTLIAGGYGPGQGVAFWDWKTSKEIRGGIPRRALDREAARVKNVAGLYSLFVSSDGKRLYTLGRPFPTPDKFKTRIQVWDLTTKFSPELPKAKPKPKEPSPEPDPEPGWWFGD